MLRTSQASQTITRTAGACTITAHRQVTAEGQECASQSTIGHCADAARCAHDLHGSVQARLESYWFWPVSLDYHMKTLCVNALGQHARVGSTRTADSRACQLDAAGFHKQHLVMSTYASLSEHTLHMFLLASCQAHQAHSSSRSLPCASPPMSICHTAPHRSRGGTAENANLLQERVAGRFSKSARGCTRLPHQAEAELRNHSCAGTLCRHRW